MSNNDDYQKYSESYQNDLAPVKKYLNEIYNYCPSLTYAHKFIELHNTYVHNIIHVIVVTWARVVYLVCMPEPRATGPREGISGKP